METPRRKLVIDRSRWLRGEGSLRSSLYRASDKKMCCLGFDAVSCGIDISVMAEVASPIGLGYFYPTSAWRIMDDDGYKTNSHVVGNMMEINDEKAMTDTEREASLIPLFASVGIDLSFIDGNPNEESSQASQDSGTDCLSNGGD